MCFVSFRFAFECVACVKVNYNKYIHQILFVYSANSNRNSKEIQWNNTHNFYFENRKKQHLISILYKQHYSLLCSATAFCFGCLFIYNTHFTKVFLSIIYMFLCQCFYRVSFYTSWEFLSFNQKSFKKSVSKAGHEVKVNLFFYQILILYRTKWTVHVEKKEQIVEKYKIKV